MKITLGQTYSFLQLGKRKNQEDARLPDCDVPTKGQRFFAVCDGVGGSSMGEVASRTVCETLAKKLEIFDFSQDFTNADFSRFLGNAWDALDRVADKLGYDMATTLTFAAFHAEGVTLAHIGDSRIYQIRPSQGIIYRSDDHSLVNQLIHTGVITPEEAVNYPQRNIITRCMEAGVDLSDRNAATVLHTTDIQKGDYIFLCTDGVTGKISDEELVSIITSNVSDAEKIQQISTLCKDSSDNNTAILIPIEEVKKEDSIDNVADNDANTLRLSSGIHAIEEVEPISQERKQGLFSYIKNKLFT